MSHIFRLDYYQMKINSTNSNKTIVAANISVPDDDLKNSNTWQIADLFLVILSDPFSRSQPQNYPHIQSMQPSIASCVAKQRIRSTDEQLDGLTDLFCFYRPNMNKILENNKENMATLGRSIVKGTFHEAKSEAAVPAIHPGFRLQVGRFEWVSLGSRW